MDLNARFYVNFARVYVNFQHELWANSITFFSISIPINIKVLLILKTKFQPNIKSHLGEMDFNVRVDVKKIRVDVNFQTAIVT